jgi:hypothetical protein
MKPHQKTLSLIFAVCAAPFVLAWTAYYFYKPTARMNYGELLPTQPVPVLSTELAAQKQWLMVWQVPTPCDTACEKVLYSTRQLRSMLGKERTRVQRVLLTDKSQTGSTDDGTSVLALSPAVQTALKRWPNTQEAVILIDPLGNQVLRWVIPAEGKLNEKKIHVDLLRLLKSSRIG